MLNVLVITTSFPLNSASRSGIFVKKLICNFPPTIQVTVITPDSSKPSANDEKHEYTLIRFRYAPKKLQQLAHGPGGIVVALTEKKWTFLLLPFFLSAAFIVSFRQALKADVIYANWSVNGVIGGIVGTMTRTPVVTTLRGTDVNKMNDSFSFRSLIRICVKLSSRIVTVSHSLRKELLSLFPGFENKMQVIHNGIDDVFFNTGEKHSLSSIRLISISNLIPGKGVNLILEALEQLANYSWTLDIVGDGTEQPALQKICVEKGLQDRIFFQGAVPPDDIPEILHRADILVFASLKEGRSNVVLEAMASGLAIVASNIPSVSELIRDGREGLLFDAGQSEDLCQKLKHLLQHPDERLKMGYEARQSILQEGFTWQAAGQRYAEVFSQTIQNCLQK